MPRNKKIPKSLLPNLDPKVSCPVIGVLHLPPLPGSAAFRKRGVSFEELLDDIEVDLQALAPGALDGVDAVIIENFGDAPFYKDHVSPATIAAMTCTIDTVFRSVTPGFAFTYGINVLRNDAKAALGIATVTQASFIRVNVLCGVYITDQGFIEGNAAEVQDLRETLCPKVRIFADVHVKHARPLDASDLIQAARETYFRAGADAIILTGSETGKPIDLESVKQVRESVAAPLLIGSGITQDNVLDFLPFADGLIVGSALKVGGDAKNPVERNRVRNLMLKVRDHYH